MNIGLSINKIKELAGSGASGVSPWRECGSATGTTQIQLPTKWTEIKIVTCNSSGLACYSTTMTYEEYQNNVSGKTYFSTFEGYNDSNFAKWCCYPTYLYLEDYHYAGDQTTKCTTTLYYKEVLENVVNIGTESNWVYYGEVSYSTAFNLPSGWEEIMCVMLDRTSVVINKQQIENKSVVYHQYKFNYYTDKWNEGILHYNSELNSVSCNECSFKVYYKKKCDNVLDINDMGEWKVLEEKSGGVVTNKVTGIVYLPDDWNEIVADYWWHGNGSASVSGHCSIYITRKQYERWKAQSTKLVIPLSNNNCTWTVDIGKNCINVTTQPQSQDYPCKCNYYYR